MQCIVALTAAVERSFADRVSDGFSKCLLRRKLMTFDELWRLELDRTRARLDSVNKTEAVGLIAVPDQTLNELLLTADDCVFLSEVGIRP